MYGIYNSDTWKKLITTVHKMHNTTTWNEKLFAGKLDSWYNWYLLKDGINNCAINPLLYLRTLREKYTHKYEEFISQLCMYEKGIRILSKGYLPISLLPPLKLWEILGEVKKAIQKTNPDYDIVIKRLYLYYDMKLVTFGIDRDRNLIIQCPIFIQPYTKQPLILYQIETVPVPIVDQNKQASSYTNLQIDGPYIALNSETYILIRQQELSACKKIGYKFYYEELFIVKHKSKHSCKSAVYFDLCPDVIKENCKYAFYFNQTDITTTLLDGGVEINFGNWPEDKHIICNVNNDIPGKIPSHLHVLVKQSVLCNCRLEVENNFLLESLAACHDVDFKLVVYFMVNTAFVSYLDSLGNLTDSLQFPVLLNRTTYEQTLPISLKSFEFNSELPRAPKTLKDFVHQFWHKKEIFDVQERHTNKELELPNKNFFFNNYTVDVFSVCYCNNFASGCNNSHLYFMQTHET